MAADNLTIATSTTSNSSSSTSSRRNRRQKYSFFERLYSTVKRATFGVLFVLSKKQTADNNVAFLLMLVDFAQLMAFPLSADHNMPWDDVPVVGALSQALGVVQLGHLVQLGGAAAGGTIFFMSLLWVIFTMGCMVFVGYSFIQNDFRVLWPLRVLRSTAQLTTVALFVPLCSMIMQVFSCPVGGTLGVLPSVQCGSATHVLLALFNSLVLILFGFFSTIIMAVFFDRDPHSESLTASAHGRIATAMLMAKAALTLLFTQSWWLPPWLLIAGSLIVSILWIGLFWQYLPMHTMWVNYFKVSLGATHLWAGISALLALLLPLELRLAGVPSTVFIAGFPVVAATAWLAARWRWQWHDSTAASRCNNAYEVELRCRRILAHAYSEPNTLSSLVVSFAYHQHQSLLATDTSKYRQVANEHFKSMILTSEEMKSQAVLAVAGIMNSAERAFPTSTMHIFVAQFMQTYKKNRHLELQQLSRAEARSPALDEAFIIFQRRKQLEEGADTEGSDDLTGNVIQRVKFEQFKREASTATNKAHKYVLEFWSGLLARKPSSMAMHKTGVQLSSSIIKAEIAYKSMLRIAPRSTKILRQYATFLMEIINNPAKAERLLSHAASIEGEAAALRGNSSQTLILMGKSVPLDTTSESVSVVVASDSKESVGSVISANAAASSLFGYSQREMLAMNVSDLCPPPFSKIHDKFLLRYLETGDEHIMGSHRISFGLHRAGYIFPLVQHVRSVQGGFGSLFEAIDSPEKAFMFLFASRAITCACKDTLIALQLDGRRIVAGETVALSQVLPGLDELLSSALAGAHIRDETTNGGSDTAAGGIAGDDDESTQEDSDSGSAEESVKNMEVPSRHVGFYSAERIPKTMHLDTSITNVPISSARAIVMQYMTGEDIQEKVANDVMRSVLVPQDGDARRVTLKISVRVQVTMLDMQKWSDRRGVPKDEYICLATWKPRLPQQAGGLMALASGSVASSGSGGEASTGMGTVSGEPTAVLSREDSSHFKQMLTANPAGGSNLHVISEDAGSAHSDSDGDSGIHHRMSAAGSVSSGSSGASSISSMNQLRSLINVTELTRDPALQRLHWSLFIVVLTSSVILMGTVALPYYFLGKYDRALELARLCGDLQRHLATGVELAMIASMASEGILSVPVYSQLRGGVLTSPMAVFNASTQYLVETAYLYQAAQQDLIGLLDTDPELRMRFEELSMEMDTHKSLDEGSREPSARNLVRLTTLSEQASGIQMTSLLTAGVEFVSASLHSGQASMQQWQNGTMDMWYILYNTDKNIDPILRIATLQALDTSAAALGDVAVIQDIVLYSGIVVVLVVAASMVVPILLKFEKGKNYIFQIFLDVPVTVVRALRADAAKKLAAANASDDGVEVIAVDSDDEDDRRVKEVVKDEKKADQKQPDENGAHPEDGNASRAAGWRMARLRRRGRELQHNHMSTVVTILKFLGPCALVIIYMVAVYLWDTETIRELQLIGGGALAARVREAYQHRISACVLRVASERNMTRMLERVDECSKLRHFFDNLHEGLVYGGDDVMGLKLQPGLATIPELNSIFTEDGCLAATETKVPHSVDYFFGEAHQDNTTFCHNFLDGLLHQGAQNMVLRFDTAAALLNTRAAHFAERRLAIGDVMIETNDDPYYAELLGSDALQLVLAVSQGYGGIVFNKASQLRMDFKSTKEDEFLMWRTIVGVCTTLLLFLMHNTLFDSMVEALDAEQKRIRKILLLMPEDAIRGVGVINAMIKDFTKKYGFAAHAAAVKTQGTGTLESDLELSDHGDGGLP